MGKNDSVGQMRERFFKKWGVDAWFGWFTNVGVLQYIKEQKISGSESFLFIDPYFGSTVMHIFNHYRVNKKTIGETTAIISDVRYIEDAVYYDNVLVGDVAESLLKLDSKFDFVLIHPEIEDYIDKNFHEILKALHMVCKPETKVMFTLNNPGYYLGLSDLLNGKITKKPYQPWLGTCFIDPEYVAATALEQGFLCGVGSVIEHQNEQQSQIIRQLQPLAKSDERATALTCKSLLFELRPDVKNKN
jgi:hypothetical protein